jgi:ABC-type cobalamin/Fe3+-siderophores transport system ATPase subunit
MKVSRLEINNFRHLEDLTFDFTYQSGPKKGQSLDRICFIGQSATGKTSLLELIKMYVIKTNEIKTEGNLILEFDKKEIRINLGNVEDDTTKDQTLIDAIVNRKMYYFSSDQLSPNNFENISKDSNQIKTELENLKINYADYRKIEQEEVKTLLKATILEFNYQTNSMIWRYILDEISVFRAKLTQKGSDLINKGLHQDFSRLGKEMEKWKKENPNPLTNLSEKCLNPILKKLNLEVDLADTSSLIPLKPINSDVAIPSNALSTGTKQLMLNSLPLYRLNTEKSMVIIDEPERSLFPDVQMELIPFYQSLAPNAQFIVATHSPFIAASFEPEERFILYFDKKGKVQVRNGVSPIGDDPNDILKNDFGLEHLMNASGIKAYKDYLNLKQKMASEDDEKKKKELLKEVVSLGDKYKL